jgi:ArsR family transcriptional regulator
VQHLHRAGLVTQRRVSRQLIYAANFDSMNGLVAFLTENCCGQADTACVPICNPAKDSVRAAGKKSA